MSILLTGATGFLGSHILKRLISLNHDVVVLKRSKSDLWRLESIANKIKMYDVDIVPLEKIFEECKIDIVIHTATTYGRNNESLSQILETNLMFSIRLLETAVRFNTDTFFNTDTLLYKYLNTYSLSKKQFTEWLKSMSDKIRVINLKLEHMYGIDDDNKKFISWVIEQMIGNVSCINLTEGKQKRDFIYIDDVVDAYIIVLEKYAQMSSFNEFDVGTGTQVELKKFIDMIYEEVKKHKDIRTVLNFGVVPYREGEFMDIDENVQPLLELGWKPKTSLEDGIKKLVSEKLK
ncbi:NAD(P)-dependent oxidoreductase [Seleniivibrio woodruffii]|uniref:NAD-dependent epimerase/dehydratase family protein n=1 Tax=Seleniivibrio woodruffii TaxID=1078050 RepID=UPI0026ECF9C0|nr:NAD-dependent epimerase/dehydratase [Seleniivibrio woodruffii]